MKQADPKVWNYFPLSCTLVDKKLSNDVRTDLSGYLLTTSITNFNAYGHNYVVIMSAQLIIAFESMLWAQYVKLFIMRSTIPFWRCVSTPLKAMVWFASISLSLKNIVLKVPFSAWYFWIFMPNVAAYYLSACFASKASFDVVLSLKCI